MLALFEGGLQKTIEIIMNWRKWSEIVEVKLSEFTSGEIVLENILSISVLECEVGRVVCKIYWGNNIYWGIKELISRIVI